MYPHFQPFDTGDCLLFMRGNLYSVDDHPPVLDDDLLLLCGALFFQGLLYLYHNRSCRQRIDISILTPYIEGAACGLHDDRRGDIHTGNSRIMRWDHQRFHFSTFLHFFLIVGHAVVTSKFHGCSKIEVCRRDLSLSPAVPLSVHSKTSLESHCGDFATQKEYLRKCFNPALIL